jgi:hypothetical protein
LSIPAGLTNFSENTRGSTNQVHSKLISQSVPFRRIQSLQGSTPRSGLGSSGSIVMNSKRLLSGSRKSDSSSGCPSHAIATLRLSRDIEALRPVAAVAILGS